MHVGDAFISESYPGHDYGRIRVIPEILSFDCWEIVLLKESPGALACGYFRSSMNSRRNV